jgi:hemoglobin
MKEDVMEAEGKKDIEGRADVERMVDRFYEKVGKDPELGPIFNDIAAIDWDAHLPKMYDFWSSILFGEGSYKSDPMSKHVELDKKVELSEAHFQRWLELFQATLEENFQGPMRDHVLQRARSIAGIMQHRIQRERAEE